MNAAIRTAYINALLADASYVEGLVAQDPDLVRKLERRLTQELANFAGSQFRVVTQFTDPRGSGFSVTVFDGPAGQRYIAFRGTERESLVDWLTNFDAFFESGLGRRQVIAMVNWYLRASTPTDTQTVQILEVPAIDQLTGEVLARTVMVQGEGTLPVAGSYVVNGHSLGGHLTTVFSRLFNDRVASSHTFNGLGVGRLFPEGLIGEIETALGLGATSWTTVDAKQKNYYAQHGISVATTDWWLQQRGERIALFNEAGVLVPNHYRRPGRSQSVSERRGVLPGRGRCAQRHRCRGGNDDIIEALAGGAGRTQGRGGAHRPRSFFRDGSLTCTG